MAEKRQGPEKIGSPQGAALISVQHQVERAAGDFRRGAPVLMRNPQSGLGQTGGTLVFAAETLSDTILERLRCMINEPLVMLLTSARAATLKIRLYTPDVVGVTLESDADAKRIFAIADPASDLAAPLKGPFQALRGDLPQGSQAAIRLAKLAGLLPAALAVSVGEEFVSAMGGEVVAIDARDVLSFENDAARTLQLVARARMPLEGAEACELVSFRPADGGTEHHAILIGKSGAKGLATPGPVLTRLHSECFTGDLLGSLRCDCGDQLRGAVEAIAVEGGGVLLYLAQEGRGIGLMNKLRAYSLQDQGFDTIEANERLGFEADERLYDTAARMLQLLGYSSVKLMTNNPEKIQALESSGIKVAERVAHSFPDNVHNRDYLKTKAKRGGHLY
ncbi:MAG: GTP cyclohydrolase II [Micropepsaceae bacterium]